LIFPLELLIF